MEHIKPPFKLKYSVSKTEILFEEGLTIEDDGNIYLMLPFIYKQVDQYENIFEVFDNLDQLPDNVNNEFKENVYNGKIALLEKIRKCLQELCSLKDYKDDKGKDEYYQERQPALWKHANDLLNRYVSLTDK